MKRLLIALGVLSLLSVLSAAGCSDKNSQEACLYETTMNLDKGNYDAVLQSACATPMHKGAAYLGKAGFTATGVINRFIDANAQNAPTSDLNLYMSSLIGRVTGETLTNLDNAHLQYDQTSSTAPNRKDADFYLSIVDALRGLAFLKSLVDLSGSGTLNTGCDANGNGKPDEVDAASTALLVSAGSTTTLPNVTVATDISGLVFSGITGTYRGLIINVLSSVNGTTASCPIPNEYKKLFVSDGAGGWRTTSTFPPDNACVDISGSGTTWPCPLQYQGQPLDVVQQVDAAISSSLGFLSTAITKTSQTDVQQAIGDIKSSKCCTLPGEDPNIPASCTCSGSDLAEYLQTI